MYYLIGMLYQLLSFPRRYLCPKFYQVCGRQRLSIRLTEKGQTAKKELRGRENFFFNL
jgi:hypothetical protein